MRITFEQFKRAFDALKASNDRRQRINAALNDDTQSFNCDIGSDPAVWEFQRLLEAWTRDREDESGPWPDDLGAEGDISIGLATPGFMTLLDEKGSVLPHLTTAEDIWAHWRVTSAGPFRPMKPWTMQDVRLCAGEGKLSAQDVLNACNALRVAR